MKKNTLFTLIYLLANQFINAQVLFTENFDTYANGDLNPNYDNVTSGQGGWITGGSAIGTAKAIIAPETGKGKVLTVLANNSSSIQSVTVHKDINSLWNNRTSGNNILKLTYEIYGIDNFRSVSGVVANNVPSNILTLVEFNSLTNRILSNNNNINTTLKDNTTPFPYGTWITTEMYIDFNTNKVYYYIPTLNILHSATFTHNLQPVRLNFNTNGVNQQSVVKYDNIELSAIQKLPSIILSTSKQLASKFNLYPNPVTYIVNITSDENIPVIQAEIYDLSGKLINTQKFNGEIEIQLNLENLASGTYMLHMETKEGTVVKKLIKK